MKKIKIIEFPSYLKEYQMVISYGVLAFQYLIISIFPKIQNTEVEQNYIYLWFFDIFLTFPIIILSNFPIKPRRIISITTFILIVILLLSKSGFNTIYFNTFITIAMSNRFLLFNIDNAEKKKIYRKKLNAFFIGFAVCFVVMMFETLIGSLGIIEHEKVGEDGIKMSIAGKMLLFIGYYSWLAYIEYKKIIKVENS